MHLFLGLRLFFDFFLFFYDWGCWSWFLCKILSICSCFWLNLVALVFILVVLIRVSHIANVSLLALYSPVVAMRPPVLEALAYEISQFSTPFYATAIAWNA